MTFSLFGFLGNVMLDYNWGTNPITNTFAIAYNSSLRWMIPVPTGFYGVAAAGYFALLLLSFVVMNRREAPRKNVLQALNLAGWIIVLFELGLWYFVPYFMDKWVIDALRATPLQAFTNWDFLIVGIGITAVTQTLLFKYRPVRTA
jgi:hypothetical protein